MGVLKNLLAKVQEYVKLAPWLQYVGLQVSQIPGLHEWKAVIATAVSFGFFLINRRNLGPNDPKLRALLAVVGYPMLIAGSVSHHLVVQFVGAALVMTEFVYELIYP